MVASVAASVAASAPRSPASPIAAILSPPASLIAESRLAAVSALFCRHQSSRRQLSPALRRQLSRGQFFIAASRSKPLAASSPSDSSSRHQCLFAASASSSLVQSLASAFSISLQRQPFSPLQVFASSSAASRARSQPPPRRQLAASSPLTRLLFCVLTPRCPQRLSASTQQLPAASRQPCWDRAACHSALSARKPSLARRPSPRTRALRRGCICIPLEPAA